MNHRKVLAIAIIDILLTLRLCVTSEIESKFNHSNGVEDYHPTESQIVNGTDLDEMDTSERLTTTTAFPFPLFDIKIVDQKYSQNTSGEYKHE